MELVSPAGNLPALDAALEAGADAVYTGFRDQTNARAFPGLNFTDSDLARGIRKAHDLGRKVYIALNTNPDSGSLGHWERAVDRAAGLGADAVIVADPAVMEHACRRHPQLALHASVQASATSAPALRYLHERFGIRRAVLPRVLSLRQVEQVSARSPVPVEVFCSARCFTARAHDLAKDDCGFRCLDDPEGLPLATREGAPLLRINGVQVLGEAMVDLGGEWLQLEALGAEVLRIVPEPGHTAAVVARLRVALDQRMPMPADDAGAAGYWRGAPGYPAAGLLALRTA
jgi:collagenase-like PrtC family protease